MNMTHAKAYGGTAKNQMRCMKKAPATYPPPKKKRPNRARRHRLNPERRTVAENRAAR